MKVLLAVACLMAVGFAQEELLSLAKTNDFLYNIQAMLKYWSQAFDKNGELKSGGISSGFKKLKNDLCYITMPEKQAQDSLFLGKTCKAAFVELYVVDDESNQCGGGLCNALESFEASGYQLISRLIKVKTDTLFFQLIEDYIVTPIMKYSCRCTNKMMDAWLGCNGNIGEAGIWSFVKMKGAFDIQAEYLKGQDWKSYWVDLFVNEIPWDDLSAMLNRINDNMCQDNAQGEGQCYNYFYDTFTTLYPGYFLSDGQELSVKKLKGNKSKSPYDESCSKFDLSVVKNEEASVDDIKDALVRRFCNAECSGLYQEVLLGCCTASMITDNELEDAIKNSVEVIKEIYMSAYEDEAEETRIMIDEYFGYYDDAMSKLRDPTCENGVSYDVTPCDQYKGPVDPCDKNMKMCQKKKKGGKKGKKAKGGNGGNGGKGGRVGKYKGKGAKKRP